MKVLSLRQPYAEWVVSGRKTIELRTWNTNFRGKFFVHASGKNESLPTGVIVGSVDLVEVKEYEDENDFLKDEKKHCCNAWFLPELSKRKFKFGFVLKNAKRMKPIKAKGNLGFWNYSK